ncbi:MAG: hypothetical protein WC699_11200 [Bacteroidales bacterium]|jgi:hypothetical protein
MNISTKFVGILADNRSEVNRLIGLKPDWSQAQNRFDQFYRHLSNPVDTVWNASTVELLVSVYFTRRDQDKGMSNITLRTLAGMPENQRNQTKIIFLQIAEACTFFNSSHKVNFDPDELPVFSEIPMMPAKVKGMYTFAHPLPGLYLKTSLTFDYWVPKILEWTAEVRKKGLAAWKGEAILHHEACTDFMRISLLFLSEPDHHPPVAKAEERETLLMLLGEEFAWIKKSAKREDILLNSAKIVEGLRQTAKAANQDIPLEAWSRILPALKLLK